MTAAAKTEKMRLLPWLAVTATTCPAVIRPASAASRQAEGEVLAMISVCNIRNYSIFRHGELLFAYFEYVGEDYEADMAKMAADPRTREWWTWTEPMQSPLETRAPGEWWITIKEVFHTD